MLQEFYYLKTGEEIKINYEKYIKVTFLGGIIFDFIMFVIIFFQQIFYLNEWFITFCHIIAYLEIHIILESWYFTCLLIKDTGDQMIDLFIKVCTVQY